MCREIHLNKTRGNRAAIAPQVPLPCIPFPQAGPLHGRAVTRCSLRASSSTPTSRYLLSAVLGPPGVSRPGGRPGGPGSLGCFPPMFLPLIPPPWDGLTMLTILLDEPRATLRGQLCTDLLSLQLSLSADARPPRHPKAKAQDTSMAADSSLYSTHVLFLEERKNTLPWRLFL